MTSLSLSSLWLPTVHCSAGSTAYIISDMLINNFDANVEAQQTKNLLIHTKLWQRRKLNFETKAKTRMAVHSLQTLLYGEMKTHYCYTTTASNNRSHIDLKFKILS